jgi:hypothetical protein
MRSNLRNRRRALGLASVIALGAFASSGTASAAPPSTASIAGSSVTPRAFLRLELPKHAAYVGESIPVTVRAYYRADTGATLTGAPTLNEKDFTLGVGDPAQGSAVVGGVKYRVVTWKDHLAPVKAGHYAIGVEMPSTLEWQDVIAPRPAPSRQEQDPNATQTDPFGGDPFRDPFFAGTGGDPFRAMRQRMQRMTDEMQGPEFGPVQRKNVVLHSPDAILAVNALPAAGRPVGFTDAVGHFAIAASAEPTHVRAGEPITLSLRVTGDGNFGGVSVPGIAESSDWKTYTASAVDGKDEKTFKQPIVPLHAGVAAIPPASFSYFDPDAAKYVTLNSAPIAVDVAQGSGAIAGSNGNVPASTSGPSLTPNAEVIGRPVANLAPVFMHGWFWGLQLAPLFGLGAAALVVLGRRRLANDPHRPWRRMAKGALRKEREAMNRAFAANDVAGFFAAARGAIQQTLGSRWHIEPAAISLSEIQTRLGGDEVEKLRPVFDADAARFSGVGNRVTDLAPWKERIEQELDYLEQLEAA